MQELRNTARNGRQNTWTPVRAADGKCADCLLYGKCFCQSVDADMPEINQSVRLRRVRCDEILFQQGETASFAGVLRSGILRIEHMRQDGDRLLLGLVFPGTIFGVFDRRNHVCSLEAAADSEVCIFQPRMLERLKNNREMYRRLLKSADRQLGFQLDMIWRRGALSSRERIIAFLLMAAKNMPVEHQCDGSLIINIGISRKDWAAWSDVSVESISRTLSQLSERDLVTYLEPGRYRVRNLRALSSLAGLESEPDTGQRSESACLAPAPAQARLRAVNADDVGNRMMNE